MTGWGTILVCVLGLIIIGMIFHWLRGHDRRWRVGYAQMLSDREQHLAGMIADSVGLFREGFDTQSLPAIVVGESALSARYYNNVLPDTRSRFSLQDNQRYTFICQLARREALVRLLEAARSQGYNAVCQVTVDATDMGHTFNASQRAMVIVTATGTAYRITDPAPGKSVRPPREG